MLKKKSIILLIILLMSFGCNCYAALPSSLDPNDAKEVAKIATEAVYKMAYYEGKEDARREEINYLKLENIVLKIAIVWLAVQR